MNHDLPCARSFDLHGLPLTVSADDGLLLRSACAMLEPLAVDQPPADPWRIDVHRAAVERGWVADRPLVAHGHDERGQAWELHYQPGQGSAVWVGDRTAARVDLPARRAVIRAAPGAEREVAITAMIVALDDLLSANEQYMIHAACLRRGAATDGPLMLLLAPSGTGKTTTSLALARKGLALMSDDAAVLSQRDGRVVGWGLPRATKVSPHTARMLPWLGEMLPAFNGQPEQAVGLEALKSAIDVAAPTPAPIGLIVALDQPNRQGHRIEPIDRMAALQRLAHENVRPIDRSAGGVSARRLAMLTRTAAAAPAVRLSVGPDPTDVADLLGDWFTRPT